MPDFIQVPSDGGGKKVHARQVTLPGGDVVHRQHVEDGYTNPQSGSATQAAVAAGGQTSLDSGQITAGKVGKLVGLWVASTVPLKVALHTVVEGAPSASPRVVWIAGSERTWAFRPPSRDVFKLTGTSGGGFDGWRCVVTNLDPSESADVYATFVSDEEDA